MKTTPEDIRLTFGDAGHYLIYCTKTRSFICLTPEKLMIDARKAMLTDEGDECLFLLSSKKVVELESI